MGRLLCCCSDEDQRTAPGAEAEVSAIPAGPGGFPLPAGIRGPDIAAFTAAQVDDSRYIGAAPAISN
jgi:hypothetical protein